MDKIRSLITWMSLFVILSLGGCGEKETQITGLEMLKGGKTFAVPTGTAADQIVLKRIPDAKFEYYNSILDCSLAVKDGKADAAAYDLPILNNIAAKNEGLVVLSELIMDDQYGFAVRLDDKALKTTIDQVVAELKSNGTYEAMKKRWFPEKGDPAPMPQFPSDGKNGTLNFGTAAVTEPMSFFDANKQIVGFDIEIASRVAQKLGKKLLITDMEFGAMIPALISGKVDMVGAGLSITAERAKSILFSECYYKGVLAVIVRGKPASAPAVETGLLKTVDDIHDKRIGVLLGSIHDAYATKTYPDATILEYQNVSDMLFALNSDKVDVAFMDESSLKEIFSKNPELGVVDPSVFIVPIAAGFNKENDQLREQFNAFLLEIRSNGIYKDMVDRWMEKGLSEMPEIKTPAKNGTLKPGIVSDLGLPFTVIKDGQLIGFDIELSKRFAASVGKGYEPVDLPFASMLASVSTNKIDVINSSLMITEERKKQIDFSDPYYESGVSVIAKKKNIVKPNLPLYSKLDDIADKKIGIFTATVHDAFITKKYPKAKIYRFESTPDMMMSVKAGKVDFAMFDLITARMILKHNPDLGILSDSVLNMPVGVGFSKGNDALRNEFNDFLKEVRKDGTYDTIYKRWFTGDPETAVMPAFKPPTHGKKLVVGISVDDLPYIAEMNGNFVGFDIEMLNKFAERRNYQIEFVVMEFPSLLPALASGKVEMITDGIAISEERAQQIDFSDPYAEFRTVVVTPKKNLKKYAGAETEVSTKTLFTKISDSFYSNIVFENRYLHIINGLYITLIISIFAALFGTLVGGLVCFMRMSKRRILSATARAFISVLRGTPVLVLLMIIYYVVFASVNINPVVVAIFAFGLNFGAYVSEMFRTSIQSIDSGQKEAAIAGGFTKVQTFIYIILPQAMRQILPVYKGEFISLIKMTSIVGYIAVQDLTKASDIIRSRTFDAFFPLIMVAVLYFLLAWLLTWALGLIELSVDPKRKREKRAKEAAR